MLASPHTVVSLPRRDKDIRTQCDCLSVSFDLLVRSVNILAGTVSARVPVTLVDVVRAIRSREARCTRALVAVFERATLGPVSTGRRGAVILSFAVLAWKKKKRQYCSTSLVPMHIIMRDRKNALERWQAYITIQLQGTNSSVLVYHSSDDLIFSFRFKQILF